VREAASHPVRVATVVERSVFLPKVPQVCVRLRRDMERSVPRLVTPHLLFFVAVPVLGLVLLH